MNQLCRIGSKSCSIVSVGTQESVLFSIALPESLWCGLRCVGEYSRAMAARQQAIRAVLVDLSGTIHIEDTAIPGAQQALKRLRETGVAVKFVTNTTKEPMRVVFERLRSLGFDISRSEIFTSLTAARKVVEAKGVRPLLMLEHTAKEDFQGITEENPNAVVVGLAPSVFNYGPMNEAFRLLLEGAPLVAIHKGRYYKKKDGLLHLGPGPFVSALEFATGATAEVVGKPEGAFFHQAIQGLSGVTPHSTVMIGDDARDDVGGAQAAGMRGILVKTGKYRDGDEGKLSPAPWKTCEDFPTAVKALIEEINHHCK